MGSIALVAITAVRHIKSRRALLLLGCLFLISIAPVLQIIPFGNKFIFADRFMYFPSIGFFTLIIYAVNVWSSRATFKVIAVSIAALLTLGFSYMSFLQTRTWQNSMTLWQNALDIYPNSSVANNNLAAEYFKLNKLDRCIQLFEKAIELDPTFAEPKYGLGALHTNLKNFELAKELLVVAILLNPNDRTAHYNFGVWAETQSLWPQAFESYQKSVALDPYFANGYVNLSSVNFKTGNLAAAKENLLQLFNFNRTLPEAYNNLGQIYLAENNAISAITSFEKALELKTDFLTVYES